MTLVELKNVHKSYTTGSEVTHVLIDLDFNAAEGEMIMIMGPSGSGKTTMLNLLGGIDKPEKGTVSVGSQDLTKLSKEELNEYRRYKVGFIFQFYNLLPTLTAVENVELGIEALVKDKIDLRKRAERYMKLVDLEDKMENFPHELSGGQQQRVAIARALAREPELILADEPTGNLDEEKEADIMALMKKIQKEVGVTFIIVSHNSRLKQYMDRTMDLRHGKLEDISE